jgi:nucleoside-diphosphate-sugar epimerase/CBS domain-containing protein
MKFSIPILSKSATIQEAIRKIELSPITSAFVVDEQGKFLSQVSLQQLRRLILSGADSSSKIEPYLVLNPVKVERTHAEDRVILASVAKDMEMQNLHYAAIVNKNNRVVGVLSLKEIKRICRDIRADETPVKALPTKNVLVVGGAGYLGSVLAGKLLQSGRRVRILDSFIYGKRSLQALASHKNLEIVEGDFRNIQTVVNSLRDIDAVILLAAVVGDPAAHLRPEQTIETNILATQALAFACKLHCISRFLFASTCSVYGRTSDVLDENAPLNPVSLYARTKIFSERSILDLAGDNFSPTILRMGTLYGYSPRMRFDLVVNTMSMKAHVEKRIQVFGGKQWRPLLHVEDAADAFVACLDTPLERIGCQIFNVGANSQNYQVLDVATMISGALHGVKVEVEETQLDERDYRVNFDKIARKLRFQPELTIPHAARKIVRELRTGALRNPYAKLYYNHYFDSTEES